MTAPPIFVAPRLLRSPHLQTSIVPYLPSPRLPLGERVEVPIEGAAGARLVGRLHRAGAATEAILIVHGIAGTADEPFVLRTTRLALAAGIDALRFNLRGGGESADCGVAPLYHAGLTADVARALAYLTERYDRVHAIGFSLGGQLCLRTFGELGAQASPRLAEDRSATSAVEPSAATSFCGVSPNLRENPLRGFWLRFGHPRLAEDCSATSAVEPSAATSFCGVSPKLATVVAISPPVDLAVGAAFAERLEASPYRIFIVRELLRRYRVARAQMGPRFTDATVAHVRTVREYDDAVVAPFFGFASAAAYYERVQCRDVIEHIAARVLIIHADDDPLVPVGPVHAIAARRLANVTTWTTSRGGHVGFLAARVAPGDRTRFWAEERAISFIANGARR